MLCLGPAPSGTVSTGLASVKNSQSLDYAVTSGLTDLAIAYSLSLENLIDNGAVPTNGTYKQR